MQINAAASAIPLRLRWTLALCALSLMLGSLPAQATMVIWPTSLVIQDKGDATALWLENRGTELKVMQMRVFVWTQENGDDRLLEQQTVVGSPPMMRIEPGKKQMIRLINTVPAPPGKEITYRIIIDEIPVDEHPPPASETGHGVRFQLRYSVPLFVYGDGLRRESETSSKVRNAAPNLTWQTVRQDDQDWLEIRNTGTVHARLAEIGFNDTTAATAANALSGYVLAGSYMRWPLPGGADTTHTLMASINGDPVEVISRVPDR